MKIEKLLDETKHAAGIKSDGELARMLGVSKQAVSKYYHGERVPDEYACLKIAEITKQPLDTIIATVKAATEKDATRRAAWENYMKRLGGIAASFLLVVGVIISCGVTMIVTSPTANARPTSNAVGSNLYYVNNAKWKVALSQVKAILSRIAQKCSFGVFRMWIAQVAA